jgi:hypothetical protein
LHFFDFFEFVMLDLVLHLAKSAGASQNLEDTSEGLRIETRADMRILDGLLFMWGVVPSF